MDKKPYTKMCLIRYTRETVGLMERKTLDELVALKKSWVKNPIWDIENTKGFEEFKDHLLEWRKNQQIIWDAESRLEKIERGLNK